MNRSDEVRQLASELGISLDYARKLIRSERGPATHKGHWPSGKRRHPDAGEWSAIRLRLTALLEDHYSPRREPKVSCGELARTLNVNDRTVRRWRDGIDNPDEDTQAAIGRWVSETLEMIGRGDIA